MLSNIELMLIKFVMTKPSYAYEIERMIEEREIRTWVKSLSINSFSKGQTDIQNKNANDLNH